MRSVFMVLVASAGRLYDRFGVPPLGGGRKQKAA